MVLESEKIGKEPENAPYIGITGTNAEVGAKLTSIIKKGPAEKAGLKKDDIVLGVDATRVHSYNDFLRAVRQHVRGALLLGQGADGAANLLGAGVGDEAVLRRGFGSAQGSNRLAGGAF